MLSNLYEIANVTAQLSSVVVLSLKHNQCVILLTVGLYYHDQIHNNSDIHVSIMKTP